MIQVFEYFDKEVTKANGYQVKEAYTVSQDLLAVLDGEPTVAVHGAAVRLPFLRPDILDRPNRLSNVKLLVVAVADAVPLPGYPCAI